MQNISKHVLIRHEIKMYLLAAIYKAYVPKPWKIQCDRS